MRVKYISLVNILFAFSIFTKMQSRLVQPFFEDDIAIIICGLGLFVLACIISRMNLRWRDINLYIILVVYVFLFAFMLRNPELSSYINSYFFAYIGYILIAFGTSAAYASNSKNSAWKLIKSCYVITSVFLVLSYVLNFDNFVILRNPLLLLETNFRRTRSAFGFVHANTTAGLCFMYYTIHMILKSGIQDGLCSMRKSEKRLQQVCFVIITIMLISTASRGCILAVALLFSVKGYLSIEDIFSDKRTIRVIKPFMMAIFVGIAVFYIYVTLIESGIFDLGYRIQNFTDNIPTLLQKGRLFVGLGLVDKAVFGNGRVIIGTGYTDNYFLYVLVSTGILGCIFIVIFFAELIIGIRKRRMLQRENVNLHRGVISVLVAQLFFSMSEAEFINPASANSLICLVMYSLYISGKLGIIDKD